MNKEYTAVYKKSGSWYIAWVEEIPGINTQGKTLEEARSNLSDALSLVIDTNKAVIKDGLDRGKTIREPISIPSSS